MATLDFKPNIEEQKFYTWVDSSLSTEEEKVESVEEFLSTSEWEKERRYTQSWTTPFYDRYSKDLDREEVKHVQDR